MVQEVNTNLTGDLHNNLHLPKCRPRHLPNQVSFLLRNQLGALSTKSLLRRKRRVNNSALLPQVLLNTTDIQMSDINYPDTNSQDRGLLGIVSSSS